MNLFRLCTRAQVLSASCLNPHTANDAAIAASDHPPRPDLSMAIVDKTIYDHGLPAIKNHPVVQR